MDLYERYRRWQLDWLHRHKRCVICWRKATTQSSGLVVHRIGATFHHPCWTQAPTEAIEEIERLMQPREERHDAGSSSRR